MHHGQADVIAPFEWKRGDLRFGDDRTALAKRRSRSLMEPITFWQGLNLMQIAHRIKGIWDETDLDDRPSAICVDAIGIGAGVVDRLNEMVAEGHFEGTMIIGINVSESASIHDKFARLRDELWWRARSWFEKLDVSMQQDVEARAKWILEEGNEEYFSDPTLKMARKSPIVDELRDILFSYLPNGKIKLEPKQDTKERLGRSPDGADAFVLTFAESDLLVDNGERRDRYRRRIAEQGSEWVA